MPGFRGTARIRALRSGVTFLPGNSLQRELRQGEVVAIPLADRVLNQYSMDFGVLAGHYLPTTISQFLTILDLELGTARDRARRKKAY